MKKQIVDQPPQLMTLLLNAYAVARNQSCAHAIVKFHIALYKYWKYNR